MVRLKIAIAGTRGIPARYGGFETFAERLALGLTADGIATTVYCRRHYATVAGQWQGIRLVTLPTIRSKYLETVVHTLLSSIHLVLTRGPRDVVLIGPSLLDQTYHRMSLGHTVPHGVVG